MTEKASVATQILDAAQRMVQTRGYNGFSYADISDEVGLRKASIHHYFPRQGRPVPGRGRALPGGSWAVGGRSLTWSRTDRTRN